ncbi:MAG: zf-HC2 domain-containing protein [Planctomycetota bacterium]
MGQKATNYRTSHFIDDAVLLDVDVSCDNFELRVNEALDRRVSPKSDARLAEHAKSCPGCRLVLHEYVSVDDSLRLLKGDIDSILAKHDSHAEKPDHRRLRSIIWVAASALLLLFCLGLMPGNARQPNVSMLSANVHSIEPPVKQVNAASSNANETKTEANNPATTKRDTYPDSAIQKTPGIGHSALDTSWQNIRSQLGQLEPVLRYSSEFPNVYPVAGTVNITIELIRKTLSRKQGLLNPREQSTLDPDLGHFNPVMLAARC